MENIDNATQFYPVTQPRPRAFRIAAIWSWFRGTAAAARSRRELLAMDDRLFADIGTSRGEALMESSRRWWDSETQPDPTRQRRGR